MEYVVLVKMYRIWLLEDFRFIALTLIPNREHFLMIRVKNKWVTQKVI